MSKIIKRKIKTNRSLNNETPFLICTSGAYIITSPKAICERVEILHSDTEEIYIKVLLMEEEYCKYTVVTTGRIVGQYFPVSKNDFRNITRDELKRYSKEWVQIDIPEDPKWRKYFKHVIKS